MCVCVFIYIHISGFKIKVVSDTSKTKCIGITKATFGTVVISEYGGDDVV